MGSVMALREREVTAQVVSLADTYADALASALSAVSSEEMLRQVIAGTLLTFLADALTKVQLDD